MMIQMIDLKNSKILIVDDNSQNIRLVNAILNEYGFNQVLFATSGIDALKIVDKENPDLILLDIMMPEMDGYEVCKKLKENDKTSDIPVIFLTAKAYANDILKGLKAGAVDYITKPFDNDILLARVKTHLTIKQQSKLLEDKNKTLEDMVNKEVEKRIKLNGKLSALYEQSNFGISFIDKKGSFIECNDMFGKMLGYEKSEILQMSPMDLTHEKDQAINEKLFNNLIENKTSHEEFLKRCIKKDGTNLWFQVSLTRIECQLNNDNFYIASVCEDVTEKIALENELKTKEEMLITQSRQAAMGNMIGMIAHQWRQPLSVVNMTIGNIQFSIELGESIDEKELSDDMKLVLSQIKYLDQTIDDFKNFFKPNKEKELVNINDVIDQSLILIGKSLEKNNIKINKNYNLSTEIELFPNELKQVFINLMNNAKDQFIKSKTKEPIINILTSEDENNITIDFYDNGGGIPKEDMDKIGELYFTSKGEEGTGLGLYMSKMIIQKQFNGIISWKNSEDGAIFTIIIPK